MRKLLALWLLLCPAFIYGQDFIRVGSFNIANFGDTDEYTRSLVGLVNIIREMNADLIAIQEVEPNQLGTDQVERLTELLNKAAAHDKTQPYSYATSPEYTGDETTAFLWRDPVSLESEITLLDHQEDPDNDEKRTFQRVPSVAEFTAGRLDFIVVNCHLYTKIDGTTSEGRRAEYDALSAWLKNRAAAEEKDAIVLGDFNRFLNGKSAWPIIMTSNHANHYRFPLLEAIRNADPGSDPRKDEAPKDEYSTTTSKKRSIYDQIIITKNLAFPATPQFGTDTGIVAFDNETSYQWFINKWSDATKILTDHRPIWIRIQTDQP